MSILNRENPEGRKDCFRLPDISRADDLLVALEDILEPAITYDDSLHITWMNPAAEVFLGVSLERARGLSCDRVFAGVPPCRDECPAVKALRERRPSSLVTHGLSRGERLITAVPLLNGSKGEGVLEILQWPFMEYFRSPFRIRVLEEMNNAFSFEDAAKVMIDAMREVAGPVAAGVYRNCNDGYTLVAGAGLPPEIGGIPLNPSSPLYTNASGIAGWPQNGPCSGELSLLPISNGKSPAGLMVCCAVPDFHGRERLEELRSVMNSAMRRLSLAGKHREP